jgi:Ala-tRNA(Pro) deacylase
MTDADTDAAYRRLITLLDSHEASYRIIDHEPEGRTEIVSPMRGNELAAAVKCIVVMVKLSKKQRMHVLAVVPGDRRVDLDAIKNLQNGRYAGFADPETAEALAGCAVGTVLPFTWHPELELVVDPAIYRHPEIFFNAGRLDRSLALVSADHRRIARAHEAPISQSG